MKPINKLFLKVIDTETRAELRSPLFGHENFIHSLSQCHTTGQLASASEDGTARIWDIRTKTGHVATLNPGENQNLKRAKLGNWLGAASLSGDFLALGGGPQPALWHMRTRSPQEPFLPPEISSTANKLVKKCSTLISYFAALKH
jgi:WD40 repeat protein